MEKIYDPQRHARGHARNETRTTIRQLLNRAAQSNESATHPWKAYQVGNGAFVVRWSVCPPGVGTVNVVWSSSTGVVTSCNPVGKTYIGYKVARYLRWVGIEAKLFNVANYRREAVGIQRSNFFDPNNATAVIQRKKAYGDALQDILKTLRDGSTRVALFDASNCLREQRNDIRRSCEEANVDILFIESICDDLEVVLENIREACHYTPEYQDTEPTVAEADYVARISHYQNIYEPIGCSGDDDDGVPHVKMINLGSQIIIHRIRTFLQSRIVYYLMNLHTKPRSIFISRHGESMHNVHGKIGGDSELSPRGWQFAKLLPKVIAENLPKSSADNLTIWTSTLRRTIQTASFLPYSSKLQWKALDELNSGVCDGMTYEEVEEKYPEDYAARDQDKYNYRYRGGESYHDLVQRLEPIIMELERQQNILIVGHQAVIRCIYAYFFNLPSADLPYLNIPLHTVVRLTPRSYACEEVRFKANIEAVDTYRPKPKQ